MMWSFICQSVDVLWLICETGAAQNNYCKNFSKF